MCKNCSNCKCKDKDNRTRDQWIKDYNNQPESQKTGILDGAGKYDMIQEQEARKNRKNQTY